MIRRSGGERRRDLRSHVPHGNLEQHVLGQLACAIRGINAEELPCFGGQGGADQVQRSLDRCGRRWIQVRLAGHIGNEVLHGGLPRLAFFCFFTGLMRDGGQDELLDEVRFLEAFQGLGLAAGFACGVCRLVANEVRDLLFQGGDIHLGGFHPGCVLDYVPLLFGPRNKLLRPQVNRSDVHCTCPQPTPRITVIDAPLEAAAHGEAAHQGVLPIHDKSPGFLQYFVF
mmetsp:Transcript_26683/g.53365  ORF Transcript_26683/g.53365 Transcript_26683/m.53365 type:complete len:227 (+) Transcript_26683:768-1448(+)